jgi:hypothetical protein
MVMFWKVRKIKQKNRTALDAEPLNIYIWPESNPDKYNSHFMAENLHLL